MDPTRPQSAYNLNGTGYHQCPGVTYAEQTIAETVKVVFSLKNIRRADGNAGRLGGFTVIKDETETNVYLKPNGILTSWPGSMYLVVSFICLFAVEEGLNSTCHSTTMHDHLPCMWSCYLNICPCS